MSLKIVEHETLEKMTAGDAELLADVAVMFVRLLPALEARMRIGIENREASEIENAAHQLKSRVSYFGALGLQEVAAKLESHARKNEFGDIEVLNQQLIEGIEQLLAELRTLTKLALEVDDE